MQNLKFYCAIIFLGFIFIFGSCARKVSNPKIENLESRETILALNTELNKLNLALEREKVNVISIAQKVDNANKIANNSADKSQKLSSDLMDHPGDAKLANKALRASKRAKKDAKNAEKENSRLSDSNKRIEEYLKNIEQTKKEIADLDAKIQFVPIQ